MKYYFYLWRTMILAFSTVVFFGLSGCGSPEKLSSSSDYDSTELNSAYVTDNDSVTDWDPFARIAGTFYIDGDTSAAYVTVDEDGSFTAFYASGTVEQHGYIRHEKNDSHYVFVFYTHEGKPYMGFVDTGEKTISEFETGNGSFRYVRVQG